MISNSKHTERQILDSWQFSVKH